jgi:hypothetical protein
MTPRTTRLDVAVAALVCALAFGHFYLFHRLGWFMEDEGVLYYHYLRVYRGDLPYRDFFTGYGPIPYYLHAWAFAVLGVSINAIRIFMAVVNAASTAGLYLVARRVTSRGFALIPPAFFVVMQPWDIAVMVFQNSPYPSWHAITLTVWGTWAVLRALEYPRRRSLWLLLAGFLGGAAFFTKQNAGTFFLWGITGFLASQPTPAPRPADSTPRLGRLLRAGYLILIPLVALSLVRNFLEPVTLLAFVLPVAALAVLGARQRFGAAAWRTLRCDAVCIAAGVGLAVAPWLLYFGREMGLGRFLTAILFLGAEVDRNLFIPFPMPQEATLALLVPILVLGVILGRRRRDAGDREAAWVWGTGAATLLAVLAVCLWQSQALGRVWRLEYTLWAIYAAASKRIDNLAAYVSLVVLASALLTVWQRAERARGGRHSALLCVLWVAACSFILYYPRMDYAHLVSAVPLVYVAGVALLPGIRARLVEAAGPRAGLVFGALCLAAASFVVATKSAPKVYSRVGVVRTGKGLQLGPTPAEWLRVERATLYFPIYLERQRLRIQAIRELIEHVGAAGRRGEVVFAFPALPMLYFLGGPPNPTRHDYFLGDNVDFAEQLNVIRTLETRQVPLVVVPNDPSDYFVAKAKDFTRVLREYLDRRYYLERRIGPYDVLRRYGSIPSVTTPGTAQSHPARGAGHHPTHSATRSSAPPTSSPLT